eukprot:maker-scaffold2471_size15358-snap-gene-0.6 protein:Tk06066 transcript:maker-scaffold2471_size15358-snap-gene-0.6-mRNA-1 annotation:"Cyclin-C"
MAGNFWQSSHCAQWILDKVDLLRERHADFQFLSEEEYQKVIIFFANFIQTLGEQLKLRQQVIATATVFFKRFYSQNSLKCVDPLLLAPTSIFLASKVEEFGVISNTRLINTCSTVIKNKFAYAYPNQDFPYRANNILECEFYLLENMDCCLVVFQPYRPLVQYCQDLGLEDILGAAWRLVNDSLRTDVSLLFPPYQIALACIHMACTAKGVDAKSWFAELNVDLDKIQEICKFILNLYELWKSFEEKKEMSSILAKMPKPKSPPPNQGQMQQQQI